MRWRLLLLLRHAILLAHEAGLLGLLESCRLRLLVPREGGLLLLLETTLLTWEAGLLLAQPSAREAGRLRLESALLAGKAGVLLLQRLLPAVSAAIARLLLLLLLEGLLLAVLRLARTRALPAAQVGIRAGKHPRDAHSTP